MYLGDYKLRALRNYRRWWRNLYLILNSVYVGTVHKYSLTEPLKCCIYCSLKHCTQRWTCVLNYKKCVSHINTNVRMYVHTYLMSCKATSISSFTVLNR